MTELIKKYQKGGISSQYKIVNGHKVRTDLGFQQGSIGLKIYLKIIDNAVSKEDLKKYFDENGQLNEQGLERARDGYFGTDVIGNQSVSDIVGHGLYLGGLYSGPVAPLFTFLGAANDAASAEYNIKHKKYSDANWDVAGATVGTAADLAGDIVPNKYRPVVELAGKIAEWGEPVSDFNRPFRELLKKNTEQKKKK